MAQDPAFLFYPSDFLVGTILMTDEQVGRYIKLICLQHQLGHLSEEDMIKICQTHDKDVFSKFIKDEFGLYFNERLEKELNRRISFSNSRRVNRLGGNEPYKPKTSKKQVSKQVSNISSTHVPLVETITITIDNKGLEEEVSSNSENSNNSSVAQVSNISSTHVEHVSKGPEEYRITAKNQHLPYPIEVCLWHYLNNPVYSQARDLHCSRLILDPDPKKTYELIPIWAAAFNRSLVNKNILTMSLSGGNESWLTYFPNWVKSILEGRGGAVDPSILFTNKDVKIKNVVENANGNFPGRNSSSEEQLAFYQRRPRG